MLDTVGASFVAVTVMVAVAVFELRAPSLTTTVTVRAVVLGVSEVLVYRSCWRAVW